MKFKLFILTLIALLVASCTREPLPEPLVVEGERSVTITATIPAETRVLYTDGPDNGQSTLAWQEGDKLLLAGYDGTTFMGSEIFEWVAGDRFTGTTVAGATTYKAYYPGNIVTLDANGNVNPLTSDFWQQTQSGNGTTGHLRNHLLLFDEEANLITEQFSLVLKSSIIRLKLSGMSTNIGAVKSIIWTITTAGGEARSMTLNINNYTHTAGA